MKFYKVVQKFFDNGHVIANTVIEEHESKPKNTCKELPKYDLYEDFFENPVEAEEFRQQALNA